MYSQGIRLQRNRVHRTIKSQQKLLPQPQEQFPCSTPNHKFSNISMLSECRDSHYSRNGKVNQQTTSSMNEVLVKDRNNALRDHLYSKRHIKQLKDNQYIRHLIEINKGLKELQTENSRNFSQTMLLQTLQDLQLVSLKQEETASTNELSHQISNLQKYQSRTKNKQWRIVDEEGTSRLRSKVKNRQSRKHIYQILKIKSENWKKIKHTTQSSSPHSKIFSIQLESRKNMEDKNFKSFNNRSKSFSKPSELPHHQESDHKGVQIKPALQVRSNKCQLIGGGTSLQCRKKKTGIQVYQNILLNLKKASVTKLEPKPNKCVLIQEIPFRGLTPWHFED